MCCGKEVTFSECSDFPNQGVGGGGGTEIRTKNLYEKKLRSGCSNRVLWVNFRKGVLRVAE